MEPSADGRELTRDRHVFRIRHGDKLDLVRRTLTTGHNGLILASWTHWPKGVVVAALWESLTGGRSLMASDLVAVTVPSRPEDDHMAALPWKSGALVMGLLIGAASSAVAQNPDLQLTQAERDSILATYHQ